MKFLGILVIVVTISAISLSLTYHGEEATDAFPDQLRNPSGVRQEEAPRESFDPRCIVWSRMKKCAKRKKRSFQPRKVS